MTSKDKVYRTIAALTAEIADRLDKVDKGTCSLSEMDHLLEDLRELEERIIIIRYKGMERMRYPEPIQSAPKTKAEEPYHAPELPLEIDPDPLEVEKAILTEHELHEDDNSGTEMIEEMVAPNQISLIDSIEEISQEASVNERLHNKNKKSVAQRLQSKPVDSVLRSLNLNQKMGLVNQLFAGDEVHFKAVLQEIDSASDLDAAKSIVNRLVTDEQREELSIVRELDSLIERRFG